MLAYSTIAASSGRADLSSSPSTLSQMARWLGKVALQKGMSALPKAEGVNYLFQRHVSRSLPASEAGFRRKVDRAVSHLGAYAEHGPPRDRAEAVFYEFGAGWDLTVPLAYWALGVDRQILVDIHSNLRFELVNRTLERLERGGEELEGVAGRALRRPGAPDVGSAAELEERFGIVYVAPRDARATGLDAESVDFVSNTNTLEHIPASDLGPILAECRRLLRRDGIMSSRIDLRDHYSYFDRSLSPYNFLRYSDRSWRVFNSRLLYQNRLRRPDYLGAFAGAGLEIVEEIPSRGDEPALASLRELELAPRFRGYALEELAVQALVVVARPAAGGSDPVSDTGPPAD
jgi:SAM-dependent methyltransferase